MKAERRRTRGWSDDRNAPERSLRRGAAIRPHRKRHAGRALRSAKPRKPDLHASFRQGPRQRSCRAVNALKSRPVFPTRQPERCRNRCAQLPIAAHSDQGLHARRAISFAREARIISTILVDRLAVEIRQPCFDTPSRHKNGNTFFAVARFDLPLSAFRFQFVQPPLCSTCISIHHDDERRIDMMASTAVFLQFVREALPHKLLCRTPACRRSLDANGFSPSHHLEKAAQKSLMLLVFAEQDKLYPTPQGSHPRASISESLRPPLSVFSIIFSVRVMPELSRRSNRLQGVPR